MKINKYLMLGGAALALGFTSCVNDLDLEPINPTEIFADPSNPEWLQNAFAQCYATMAFSSNSGAGDSNISTPDAGMSAYNRIIFYFQEYASDEAFWIWEDNGYRELVTNTFSAGNKQVEVCYSRLYQHVAVCNQFLSDIDGEDNDAANQMRTEVRALRAMTYYWLCDLWGNVSFGVDAPDGTALPQIPRAELYSWLVGELEDIVDNGVWATPTPYGRVGKDGAEALLARVYLNAEVYTNGAVSAWSKCVTRCNNVINRHKGGGFKGSGLAENYLYLFCRNNSEYMPGGGNTAENEILWGLAFDSFKGQSYGGATFLLNGALSEGMYGTTEPWSCIGAREDLSRRFEAYPNDVRWSLWIRDGRTIENGGFLDFSIAGYQPIKWTGLTKTTGGQFSPDVISTAFANCDFAFIRLADLYLMRAECYLHGAGDRAEAVEGLSLIRERAGLPAWGGSDLTADNLLDERSRELYFEMTRRSDLIRFGKYVGPTQALWSWKGNSATGTNISDRYKLLPIPTNIISAQTELKQNTGY